MERGNLGPARLPFGWDLVAGQELQYYYFSSMRAPRPANFSPARPDSYVNVNQTRELDWYIWECHDQAVFDIFFLSFVASVSLWANDQFYRLRRCLLHPCIQVQVLVECTPHGYSCNMSHCMLKILVLEEN